MYIVLSNGACREIEGVAVLPFGLAGDGSRTHRIFSLNLNAVGVVQTEDTQCLNIVEIEPWLLYYTRPNNTRSSPFKIAILIFMIVVSSSS